MTGVPDLSGRPPHSGMAVFDAHPDAPFAVMAWCDCGERATITRDADALVWWREHQANPGESAAAIAIRLGIR